MGKNARMSVIASDEKIIFTGNLKTRKQDK